MNHPFLSAVIICFNEERNIVRCLESLEGVADEVVVVDSGSTDATVELARSLGARVLHHPFEGHIQQKNWAAEQAGGAWILSLDADEALGEELKANIARWKTQAPEADGYAFNRLTSYCGHWVRHGGWYPDRKLRLWRAGCAAWSGENPHDRLEMVEGRTTQRISGDLLHFSYYTVADHIRQIRYFSDIAARAYSGPVWMTWPIVRPFKAGFQWLKNAIIRGGWRDGWAGWTIAKWSAFATSEKYRKANELARKRRALQRAHRTDVRRVLVCRTDALGDVAVTLPVVGWLAERFEVDVLVRPYAEPVATAHVHGGQVLVWDERQRPDFSNYDAAILAYPDAGVARALKSAGVPIRIGTGRRWPFARFVNFRNRTSRKNSGHHETWHGFELASGLHVGMRLPENPAEWGNWGHLQANAWERVSETIAGASAWITPGRRHIILHAGSNNSATNWSMANYEAFMHRALLEGCRVLWTGTEADATTWSNRAAWNQHPDVIDTIGKLALTELMSLIQVCDGLVASSTGPLHLASGLGRPCVGLYGKAAPIWPERWHPIGPKATWLATNQLDENGSLAIGVDAVWQALTGVWEGSPSAE